MRSPGSADPGDDVPGLAILPERLSEALASLSLDQLSLSAPPNLRSIDELARQIIAVCAGWFHEVLGVGGEDFGAFSLWV